VCRLASHSREILIRLRLSHSPDGTRVVSGSNDKTVQLWSAKTFMAIGEPLDGHDKEITSIAFTPDRTCVASGSRDATIRLWDVATSSLIGAPLIGHGGPVTSVVFSPSGELLISGSHGDAI
jgi:WD40 repeat protein